MLKSRDISSGKDVILFDLVTGSDSIDLVRDKCRKETIVCPECDQPVVVKAGTKMINHFAHKSLESCPLSSESANMLQGRKILYQWLGIKLTSKYPNNHSLILEKTFPCKALQRPMDCYCELPKNRRFAYWILESGVRASLDIDFYFQDIQLPVIKIFLAGMMRFDKDKEILRLTPTERQSINADEYALSYLDINTNQYTTFGGLHLYHSPQVYKFLYSVTHQLSEMIFSPLTGNLIHPEGHIKLSKFGQQIQATID
jgi:hypothetical protein